MRNFHFTNSAWKCQFNSACKHTYVSLSLQSLQTQSVKTTLSCLSEKRLVKFSIWIKILHAKSKALEYQQYTYIVKVISAKVINFGSNRPQSNSCSLSWRVEKYFEVKVSGKIRMRTFLCLKYIGYYLKVICEMKVKLVKMRTDASNMKPRLAFYSNL